jgi:thiol-disulfide isomerase/thioredoxin
MSGRVGLALAIAGGLLAVALVVRSGVAPPPAPIERANLVFTLEDMNGGKVELAKFAGKPLIINLWATWCGPCRLEMPQLVGFAAKFRDRGLTIIGVSVDDAPDAIRAFAAEYKVTYPMLVGLGQDAFLKSVGYEGNVPMSILIRADGTVSDRIVGLETTDAWERRILALF